LTPLPRSRETPECIMGENVKAAADEAAIEIAKIMEKTEGK
jgi:hypothetical protein